MCFCHSSFLLYFLFVLGFLIAERRKLSPGSIRIVDSVPALHASYGLTSTVENALICIDAQCTAHDPPLCIVGVYYANERYRDERCAVIWKVLKKEEQRIFTTVSIRS